MKEHTPLANWKKKLKKLQLSFSVAILEEVTTLEDLDEAERFYIAYFKSIGMLLLNVTEGGQTGAPMRKNWGKTKQKKRYRLFESGRTVPRIFDTTKIKTFGDV